MLTVKTSPLTYYWEIGVCPFTSFLEAGQTHARICSKFGRVWLQITELAAFECQNLYEENETGQHSSSFIFVSIGSSSFFAGNTDNHKVSD